MTLPRCPTMCVCMYYPAAVGTAGTTHHGRTGTWPRWAGGSAARTPRRGATWRRTSPGSDDARPGLGAPADRRPGGGGARRHAAHHAAGLADRGGRRVAVGARAAAGAAPDLAGDRVRGLGRGGAGRARRPLGGVRVRMEDPHAGLPARPLRADRPFPVRAVLAGPLVPA